MAEQVFMCYAREDEKFVLKLAKALKKQGVPVWLDQWNIKPGTNWDMEIEKALSECSHLVLVLSPASVESLQVHGEWYKAWQEHKPIIPVFYQECNPHRLLLSIQHIDFTSGSPTDATGLSQILFALGMEKRAREMEKRAREQKRRAREKEKGPPAPKTMPRVESWLATYLSQKAEKEKRASTPTRLQSGRDLFPRAQQGLPYLKTLQGRWADETDKVKTDKVEPEGEFYERPWWWVSVGVGLIASIGGAFLVDALLRWGLSLVALELPVPGGKWLALLVAGLLWGFAYAISGAVFDPDPVDLFLLPVLPYADVFDPYDFGEFLRGLLCAWPICFVVSWGGANGLAVAAGVFFDISYALMVYVAFGLLTLLCLGLFLSFADDYIF